MKREAVQEVIDPMGFRGLLFPLHALFSSATLRKVWVAARVPLACLCAAGIIAIAQRKWFAAAAGLSLLGEAAQLWCFAALNKNKTLAERGPYALVRNPMYLGRYFILLGPVALTGRLWLLPVYTVCYYFYLVNRVRREEAKLAKLFPDEYPRYCARVGRFAPRARLVDTHALWYFNGRLVVKNHGIRNALGLLAFYVLVACRVTLTGH